MAILCTGRAVVFMIHHALSTYKLKKLMLKYIKHNINLCTGHIDYIFMNSSKYNAKQKHLVVVKKGTAKQSSRINAITKFDW